MTPSELIASYRMTPTDAVSPELIKHFAFEPGPLEFGYPTDAHMEFRAEVVEALLPNFSLVDLHLIRALFQEEMACEAAVERHDSLYQLCFYLFELGQLEDCFRLYEAKYLDRSMDVGTLLDREMMTVRHEVPEVINYVETVFQQQPELQAKYPTILEELNGLLTEPDYDSLDDYRTFIRGYFYGHDDNNASLTSMETLPTMPSSYEPKPKPWWKFW